MVCNAGYIPCDMTTGEPRSLCVDSCKRYKEDCALIYNQTILQVALNNDLNPKAVDLCADTMIVHKIYLGNNFTNVTGTEPNCYNVQGNLCILLNILGLRPLCF